MIRITGALALGVLSTGCYTLQPAGSTAPQIGTVVAFDVNDVGRVALGGQMGPEIGQIQGRLVSRDNNEFVLGVTEIHLLRGGVQVWSGEQVRLKSEYLGNAYERQFSTPKTVALAAVGVGGLAWIVTRGLSGGGTEDPKGPGGTGDAFRAPIR